MLVTTHQRLGAGGVDPADLHHRLRRRAARRPAPPIISSDREDAACRTTMTASAIQGAHTPRKGPKAAAREVTGRMVLFMLVGFFGRRLRRQRHDGPRSAVDLRRRRDRERLSGRTQVRARSRHGQGAGRAAMARRRQGRRRCRTARRARHRRARRRRATARRSRRRRRYSSGRPIAASIATSP